jgi:hypothetical protein
MHRQERSTPPFGSRSRRGVYWQLVGGLEAKELVISAASICWRQQVCIVAAKRDARHIRHVGPILQAGQRANQVGGEDTMAGMRMKMRLAWPPRQAAAIRIITRRRPHLDQSSQHVVFRIARATAPGIGHQRLVRNSDTLRLPRTCSGVSAAQVRRIARDRSTVGVPERQEIDDLVRMALAKV